MRVARSVVPALAVWASAGWLGHPAYGLAARPPAPGGSVATVAVGAADGASGFASARYLHRLDLSGRPSLSCAYRLRHVHKGGHLNVRESAGLGHVPVGKVSAAQGNIAGACAADHGWVAVDTADGIPGWASARYLRKIP